MTCLFLADFSVFFGVFGGLLFFRNTWRQQINRRNLRVAGEAAKRA
jgi:hypothetical protein